MAKSNIVEAKPNTIVSGTTIKGDVSASGDFRIDGTLIGSIKCKGKIVVGETGTIEGEIECQNADLSGTIKAKINVEELLALKASAKFNGEVVTNKISIEPGAKFSGSCNMDGGMTKTQPNVPNKPEQQQKEKIFK
jgi:cytoskeletal protein CcmA (bactofilin family)